jgi:hypothetical protein
VPLRGPGDPDPVIAAARTRVAGVLDRLVRTDLQVVIVAPPDATRLAAVEAARTAALAAGRGDLLDEAIAAAREIVAGMFARSGFSGTWALTDMSMSVARASDRVAASAAFEEMAMAAVVEDLVDSETLDALRSAADNLIQMTGLPSPGSLSSVTAPGPMVRRGVIQVGYLVVVVIICVLFGAAFGVVLGLALLMLGVALGGVASRLIGRTA